MSMCLSIRIMPDPSARCRASILCTLLLAVLLPIFGCSKQVENAPDDEAKLRANAENLSVEKAALEYFTPYYKYDYFPGMDVISKAEEVYRNIPSQLIDKVLLHDKSSVRPSAETSEPRARDCAPKVEIPGGAEKKVDGTADKNPVAAVASFYANPKASDLNEQEIFGRNTWMIWCAGNEGFWDWLAVDSLGFIDLLKLVDSRNRNRRFEKVGLINEPEMQQSGSPVETEFGLYLDQPSDLAIREWRKVYTEETFAQLAEGKHKSQRRAEQADVAKCAENDAATKNSAAVPVAYNEKGGYSRYDMPSTYMGIPPKDPKDTSSKDSIYNTKIPPPDIYGLSSGVIGLRLFPNPKFDAKAQAKWDAKKYYEEPEYYDDPELIRPYRVGMSCAFCHASYHPLNTPRDLTNPKWENISGNIGAQYLRVSAAVGNLLREDDFVFQLLDSQPPGTIDTSLIASDNINNPNTMNAVFSMKQRAYLSFFNPREHQAEASLVLPSLYAPKGDEVPKKITDLFAASGLVDELTHSNDNPRRTPRILIDGSDSIGAWGAFARVYLNIGSYWERWNQLHMPLVGLTPQSPFKIADCERHSVYWHATKQRVGPMRDYFLKVTDPMPLLATANAQARVEPIDTAALKSESKLKKRDYAELLSEQRARRIDLTMLQRGREVFAKNCIVCHSSVQPESGGLMLFQTDDVACRQEYNKKYAALIERRQTLRNEGAQIGEFWEHDPGQWLQDREYMDWAAEMIKTPRFWSENFFSTDYRVPINLVQTNTGRAMATNGMSGHMWEDFASESYRKLPSVGAIPYYDVYERKEKTFTPQHQTVEGVPAGGGGPGYFRVPTLVSIWATAPFFHNNSLGLFNNDPTVDGRLAAFDDGIRKLLWPEKRLESSSYNGATRERLQNDKGLLWRTSADTYLTIKSKYVPQLVYKFPKVVDGDKYFRWLREVKTPWLLPAVLLATAFVLLRCSKDKKKSQFGIWVFGLTVLLLLIHLGIRLFWPLDSLPWWRLLSPWQAVIVVLLLVSLLLTLPLSSKWTRYLGYATTFLAVGLGAVLYLNAGKLGEIRIGPIPKGTPVNLIANINPEASYTDLANAVRNSLKGFAKIKSQHLSEEDAEKVMLEEIAPALMKVNKCPDFIMDRGHSFEWFGSMTDDDKNALIELLKTF